MVGEEEKEESFLKIFQVDIEGVLRYF